MFRILSIAIVIVLGGSIDSSVRALQLGGALTPEEGEKVLRLGFNGLIGIISPPIKFSHPDGFNDAKMFEEYIGFSYGFGDVLLRDIVASSQLTFYQSGKETLNSTQIHSSDSGMFLSLRLSGNFIHLSKFVFGVWLQGDIPFGMEKKKFVKPNINYVGGGLSASGELADQFFLSQTLFLGSGLFSPRTKNANIISNTFPSVNFGQLFFGRDFSFTTGLSVEADVTKRTDAAYAASALADGKIRNLVFVTPFVFNFPFAERFSTQGGLAVKWKGKSTRGSMFFNFEVAAKF